MHHSSTIDPSYAARTCRVRAARQVRGPSAVYAQLPRAASTARDCHKTVTFGSLGEVV